MNLNFIRSNVSWLKIITTLWILFYTFFTTYLWLKSNFELNILISIQIQSTALFIGLIASTIGLLNYLRKSGIKLEVSIKASDFNYEIAIKNLKDKEISIYNLYIPINIGNKQYQVALLGSDKNTLDHISIKAYGQIFLNLPLPRAIKVIEIITDLYPPEEEYIYINPLIYKDDKDYLQRYNIILHSLRKKQSFKYLIKSSEGYKKGNTKITKSISLTNQLIFYNRDDLAKDYISHQGIESSSTGSSYINDENLDDFIRSRATGNQVIERNIYKKNKN